MTRLVFSLLILILALVPGMNAQDTIQVLVGLTTPGMTFYVDNVPYTTSQSFRWRVGDLHQLSYFTVQSVSNPADPSGFTPGTGPAADVGTGVRYAVINPFTPQIDPQEFPQSTILATTTTTDSKLLITVRIQVFPGLKSLTIPNVKQYLLRAKFQNEGCSPSATGLFTCGDQPGFIRVQHTVDSNCNQAAFAGGDLWCAGGAATFTAIPFAGYAFYGYSSSPALIDTNGSVSFNIASPYFMQVNWGPGKLYAFTTQPPGLDIVVDRSIYRTKGANPINDTTLGPQVLSDPSGACSQSLLSGIFPNLNPAPPAVCFVWAVGSTKLLAAPDTQQDNQGRYYVFDNWSSGGGQNTAFTVSGANLSTDVITGNFIRAGNVSFNTQPPNLPLEVNRRTWPAYNFWFGLGREFSFAAPNEAVDSNGRRYRFKGWSNGGPAAQTLKVTDDMLVNTLYLTAIYEPLNRLTIETNPPGLPVTVDGKTCSTPCLVERLAAESASLSPTLSVTQANVLKLEFDGWSDGGAPDRLVSFATDSRLIAKYRQSYLFTAISNPTDGATFTFNPTSPDGFYSVGTPVSVTVKANKGYRFRRWSGDTAGLFPTASITVNGPRSVVAELETVPFLDPAGVRNSAGTGPQDQGDFGQVTPGSLITIYGVNLTNGEQVGPRSPLAQSLADAVVRVADRLLPLSYASPAQINAQLPYDLPLGRNKLTITRTGQPDVSAEFDVVRNAPGLFGQAQAAGTTDPPLVFAFRADGSVVTSDAPARPNETISLLGTGVGPFRLTPPTGFAAPSGINYALADTVEVLVGDQVLQPLQVFATPGFVGMTSIQIRVGSQFPAGQATSLRIRVNGKESNTVRLLVR